jgi:replicative superfamily II helicase
MDEELKARFDAIDVRFQKMEDNLLKMEDKLLEAMRDMQTELLRGFATHSAGMTLRVRKIEADQSNLDASLSGRVEVLEKRLGEIEQRLFRA